jgi:hypothetical protein
MANEEGRTARSAAWGVAVLLFGGGAFVTWPVTVAAGSTFPLWPVYLFGGVAAIALYIFRHDLAAVADIANGPGVIGRRHYTCSGALYWYIRQPASAAGRKRTLLANLLTELCEYRLHFDAFEQTLAAIKE